MSLKSHFFVIIKQNILYTFAAIINAFRNCARHEQGTVEMDKDFTMWNLRKIVFICVVFVALTSVSAQTTEFQFGVKGGLNLSKAFTNDASAMNYQLYSKIYTNINK